MTNARYSKTTSPSGQLQGGESPKIRFSTKFGLMMASSLAPIVFAPAANASCAAVDANLQPVALNAVTSDSVITCSGATTNETITVPAPTSGVSLTVAPGATMSDSFVSLNGNDHSIFTGLGSALDDVSFFISGDNGIIVLQGTGTNISTFVSGEGGRIVFLDGSYSTGLVAASGNSLIEVSSGASVSAAGASSGFGLLFGDAGNNVYTINGDLTSRADGLFITDVAGDDFYTIGSDASFTVAGGGQGYIVDSGASTNDVLSIFGTHNLNLDITGIDQLIYTATNAGDTLAFNGVANLNRVSVNSGTVTQIDLAAMMDANKHFHRRRQFGLQRNDGSVGRQPDGEQPERGRQCDDCQQWQPAGPFREPFQYDRRNREFLHGWRGWNLALNAFGSQHLYRQHLCAERRKYPAARE
jgi:hypothetical protein